MADHMTAEQLLPCPFCGSAAIERWHRAGDDGYFEVCCVRTACTTFRHGIDESSVRAEWNKRHDAARLSGMAAVPTWQPIGTAPKDGTIVWAFNGEQGRMKWVSGSNYALWIWDECTLSDIDPSPEQPSHWMPLPAAPDPPHV